MERDCIKKQLVVIIILLGLCIRTLLLVFFCYYRNIMYYTLMEECHNHGTCFAQGHTWDKCCWVIYVIFYTTLKAFSMIISTTMITRQEKNNTTLVLTIEILNHSWEFVCHFLEVFGTFSVTYFSIFIIPIFTVWCLSINERNLCKNKTSDKK